jgi:hypothetical protein
MTCDPEIKNTWGGDDAMVQDASKLWIHRANDDDNRFRELTSPKDDASRSGPGPDYGLRPR